MGYSCDAWRELLTVTWTMAATNPIRHRGYYYDAETGLYYLQSRYYAPELCRFINADAFASTGQGILGTNMFAYCGNNAVFSSDPNGKWIIKDFLKWISDEIVKPVVNWIRDAFSGLDGTFTLGISIVGSPSIWDFNEQIGLSIDFKGNISLQQTFVGGVTTGTPSLFGGLYCMITNAPSTEHLNGLGYQFGGSVNFLSPSGMSAGLGGEFNVFEGDDKNYYGFTGSIGIASNPGAEVHTEWGNTTTLWTINVYDELSALYHYIFD